MSDLESIISGEAEPLQAEPESPQVDEVAAEEPQVAEPVAAEPAKESTMVPLAALQEVRRELQDMKSRLPQPEAPQSPDVFDEGYTGHMRGEFQREIQNVKLDLSEDSARSQHGNEKVDAAFAALQANTDPTTYASIMGARSPWLEAVSWHERTQVARAIGNDPAAYAAKVEADMRVKIEAEMVAKQARDNAGKFAPSMANVTGTGGGPKTTWAGPTSLDAAIG